MFQNVPKNINLRITSNNSSGQFFLKIWYKWCTFLKLRRKFPLPKSFGSVAETAFSVSTADIEENVWEKANFSISSGFWTKLSGFWANVFWRRQKEIFIVVKNALYFPEVHFEDKSLWWKSNVFESAYDFEDQKFYGLLERTVWQCHQNCSLWVQTNKLKKQVFEIVFLPFSRLPGRSNYFWHEKFWSVVKTEL